MKNNVFLIVSVAFILLGSVISYFAGIPEVQLVGFAVTMLGAGLLVANIWKEKKPTAKNWLIILSLILVGGGCFVAGVTGVLSEEQVKSIIGYTFALIMLIAGIIVQAIANKTPKTAKQIQ